MDRCSRASITNIGFRPLLKAFGDGMFFNNANTKVRVYEEKNNMSKMLS